jgi:hypothetical protein
MAGMKAKKSTIPVQGVFEKLSRRSIKRAWNACIHRTLWTHLDLGENLFTDAKHTQYADGRLRRADRGVVWKTRKFVERKRIESPALFHRARWAEQHGEDGADSRRRVLA